VKFILNRFDAIGTFRVLSALDNEAGDEAMKRCFVVEAIKAQLDEVATCLWGFFRPGSEQQIDFNCFTIGLLLSMVLHDRKAENSPQLDLDLTN
jgi:hypothetical protein